MSTCSKIILLGEHSVVYGKKALAIPVKKLCINVELVDEKIKEDSHVRYIKEIIEKKHNVDKKYVKINSSIPISSGMGSSAALAIEMAKKYNADIRYVVDKAEIKMHQNPSGIDANVILNEKSIIFQKNRENIEVDKLGAYLVISHSDEYGDTKTAVNMVKKLNRDDIIEQLGEITKDGIRAYYKKDLYSLGLAFTKSQKCLEQLNLSTKRIKKIIDKAKYDSLGSKISGSGLGGVVISLCKNKAKAKKVKKKLNKSGIDKVWVVKI
ncbi:mevalonate kinase family protein [Oceanivirga salmonicida]|uniref:mevalonate kinase family protein n=1 Tax=Oceanivirga salmonicida TaxID=1769291 RepID=UPI0012E1C847|nr:hypothetical protein [Oceanivirga salmonicida]